MPEFDPEKNFEQRCPICGGDNNCAMACSPKRETCWCASVDIDPKLLETLPESSRGKACLCQSCCSSAVVTDER